MLVNISDHFPFRSRREVPAGTGTGIPASRSATIFKKRDFPVPVPAAKNSRFFVYFNFKGIKIH